MLGAVRKQEFRPASGAQGDLRDIFLENTGVEQLAAVRLREIQENLLGQFALAGSSRGQKQQWIFFVNLVGFFGVAEKAAGGGELGLECVPDFRAYLITAAANAG